MPRVIVGSPTYLDRAGMPLLPADLAEHRIVGGPAATRAASWQFERDGEEVSVELHPNISTNSIAGAIACATGNLGITSAPLWGCQEELKRGSLVQVLADWHTTGLPVHAYFPLGRSARKVARAFVEFITAELRKQ
jgi:DNA-binding transcriptional LysR family regulator